MTLVIGGIAARITFQQYKVAEAKLKLDLFERRYKIFLETWKILSAVVGTGTRETNYGLGTPFNNFIPEAKFLFGADIADYVNQLASKWTRLHAIERMDQMSTYAEERSALVNWFKEQADDVVKMKFGSYLNFDRWK